MQAQSYVNHAHLELVDQNGDRIELVLFALALHANGVGGMVAEIRIGVTIGLKGSGGLKSGRRCDATADYVGRLSELWEHAMQYLQNVVLAT